MRESGHLVASQSILSGPETGASKNAPPQLFQPASFPLLPAKNLQTSTFSTRLDPRHSGQGYFYTKSMLLAQESTLKGKGEGVSHLCDKLALLLQCGTNVRLKSHYTIRV